MQCSEAVFVESTGIAADTKYMQKSWAVWIAAQRHMLGEHVHVTLLTWAFSGCWCSCGSALLCGWDPSTSLSGKRGRLQCTAPLSHCKEVYGLSKWEHLTRLIRRMKLLQSYKLKIYFIPVADINRLDVFEVCVRAECFIGNWSKASYCGSILSSAGRNYSFVPRL